MNASKPREGKTQALLERRMSAELHWFPEDVSTSRLAATMAAMANTRGGRILIGVAPRSGEIHGLRNPQDALDKVFQAALLTDPMLVLPVPSLDATPEGAVLHIGIPEGLPHVYSLDGRYLGRDGAHSSPLPARQLRQLLLARGVVQFESLSPPGATLDDMDLKKAVGYIESIGLGDEAPEDVLLRRGCLRQERKVESGKADGSLVPTYAGLLLFGRHPQRWVPSASILAARFSGATFADEFVKQDISGTLPEQLRRAEAFVRENLHKVVRMTGLQHEETEEYPLDAVRELLVNAVAHRDYNMQGDTIHLHIFSDRIEVRSPGGLPGPINMENLLQARFSRNAVIVQVLSDMGFVERLGYGLDRVVRSMRRHGLKPPQFEESGGAFRVALAGPKRAGLREVEPAIRKKLDALQEMDVNERQEQALAYLVAHKRITNREYQDLCPDVHPETLRRDLADLVARNVLIKVGDKRATYYILK